MVVGAGPWIRDFWAMLDLPKTVTIKGRDGKLHHNIPMWTLLALRKACSAVDPGFLTTNDGHDAAGDPRRHRRAAAFRHDG